jgi:ParB-like chromosome segregation protein Spo0J
MGKSDKPSAVYQGVAQAFKRPRAKWLDELENDKVDVDVLSLKVHPVAACWPMMSSDELDILASDIEANGLRHPVVIDHTRTLLVDGQNRREACRRAGVPIAYEELDEDVDIFKYVISTNDRRRHLSVEQRAIIAARIANLKEGRPSKTAAGAAISQTEAAERLSVSRGSVQRARKVLKDGTPELVESLEKKEVALATAETIAAKPKAEQVEALLQAKAAKLTPRIKTEPLPPGARVVQACNPPTEPQRSVRDLRNVSILARGAIEAVEEFAERLDATGRNSRRRPDSAVSMLLDQCCWL